MQPLFENSYENFNFIEEFIEKWNIFCQEKDITPRQFSRKLCVEFVQFFDKDFMANAKAYWNNYILVEFWKYYFNVIKNDLNIHKLNTLFGVRVDTKNKLYFTLIPINFDSLKDNSFSIMKMIRVRKTDDFDVLIKKLKRVNQIQKNSILQLYEIFQISRRVPHVDEKHKNFEGLNLNWNHLYRVIEILEVGLYFDSKSKRGFHSPLTVIMFADSLPSLQVFIEHCYKKSMKISIDSIESFLKRQRDYALKSALNISFVQNKISNENPNMFEYVESKGIVEIDFQKVPQNIIEETKEFEKELNIVSLGGCPFAKSKGLEKNIFMEYQEYFDDLFINFLKQSEEFTKIFT